MTLAVAFVLGAEFLIRLKGVRPWQTPELAVQVHPGGRFFAKHPTLGYAQLPGRFTVTLGTGYSFRVTHLPNTLRATRPEKDYEAPRDRDEVWLFGCSLTHGWSLNDEETYPWLLQERLPDYEVVNYGVNGYGTVHSLVQFREALRGKQPRVAVLAYGDFHDRRNTLLRSRRKTLVPWNRLGPLQQPSARLGADGQLQFTTEDVDYREFPLMRRSALAHFLELKYNEYEEGQCQSHRVSEALVDEMGRLARQHGVTFVVAGIAGGHDMRRMVARARDTGLKAADIAVDLQDKSFTNAPHDDHPNALANQLYADKLEAFLKAELRARPAETRHVRQ